MTTRRLTVPLYLGGAGLSLFGNSAIAIVLPWLVISRTGDLSAAALVAAAAGIAAVPASFVAGRLTDRFGHRRVAVLADVGSAASVAAIAVVDATAGLTVTWFVALGIAGAVFDVPGMTARQALLADVCATAGTSVDRVAGAFQMVFGLSFLAGPGVAGGLMSVMDPIHVVWLTAGCSAGAALSTLLMPLTRVAAATLGTEVGEVVGGWRTIRRSPALSAMLLLAFTSSFVTPPMVSVLLPGHFARLGEPEQLGLCLSVFAVGTLVGSGLYPVLAGRSRRRAFVSGIVATTAGMALFAVLTGFWVVAAGMSLLGVGSALFAPVWNVYVAEQVAPQVRGSVLGLVNAAGLSAGPLGLGVLSLVLIRWDLAVGAALIAAVWAVIAVWALASSGMRALTSPPTARPVGSPTLAA